MVPPRPVPARGPLPWKFDGVEAKAEGLLAAYEAPAAELGSPLFNAGSACQVSPRDGVRLEAVARAALGAALAEPVRYLLRG